MKGQDFNGGGLPNILPKWEALQFFRGKCLPNQGATRTEKRPERASTPGTCYPYYIRICTAPAGQPDLTHWKDWRAGENEGENGYVLEIERKLLFG